MTKDEALSMMQRHIDWTDKHPTDYMKAKIEAAIALAQPEIVQCKYCKHYNALLSLCEHNDMKNYECGEEPRFFTTKDFYCKYGERIDRWD